MNGAELKVKICGITNIEDALICAEYGADALGFIFYEKSKRFITFGKAAQIIHKLPPLMMKVGVFVDDEFEVINHVASKMGLNAVQIHSEEPPEYISKIVHPVIKTFRVSDQFNWKQLDAYNNCSLLLDTYSPNEIGGTGKSFDWNAIPNEYRSKIILSGGITINKLETIFSEIKPSAIDLSSALESMPGKKDHQKVKHFLNKFNQLRSK